MLLRLFSLFTISSLVASTSFGASVYMCKDYRLKSTGHTVKQCVVKIEEGIVGHQVDILDNRAHVVAHGRLVKRKGSYGVVRISQSMDKIKKGYPVLVRFENSENSFQWAASFSKQN